MISVKVCWRDTGKPAEGRKVVLSFDGLLSGGMSSNEYTDRNGDAHFDNSPGPGKVYVDGNTAYTGRLEGRIVVYVD
jgi:hypothetical protein